MNYGEALEQKRRIGTYVIKRNIELVVKIVPEIEEDFECFIKNEDYLSESEIDGIPYSTNNRFKIRGLAERDSILFFEDINV